MGRVNVGWTPKNASDNPETGKVPKYNNYGMLRTNMPTYEDNNMSSNVEYVNAIHESHSADNETHLTADDRKQFSDKYSKKEIDEKHSGIFTNISNIDQDFNDLAIEYLTIKNAETYGMADNVIIETFENLNDIEIEKGTYDAINRKIIA